MTPGLEHELRFVVPETKLVPALYPESPEFQEMPPVLATGFLIGLLEWACIQAIKPHLDWPRQQTVGTHVDVSHCAATPCGLEIRVRVKLLRVEGRRLVFGVQAHDGTDVLSQGRHERVVIDRARFLDRALRKSRL